MNGKGDSPRNIFTETYRQNYDEIFRKKLDGSKTTVKPQSQKDDKDEDHRTGLSDSPAPSRAGP